MPTTVQFVYNEDYSMGAMYVDGRLVETDENISGETAVDHIAMANISVALDSSLIIDGDYDAAVYAMQGFPDDISDIPEEALL